MPRIFVTRRLPGAALEKLAQVAEVDVWQGDLPPARDRLLARAEVIDGLVTLVTDQIDETLLERAPHLRVVSNVAVGYDNIDLAAATARGVLVTNTPGVLTETTADFAFALLMAAARRIVEGDRFVREGKWQTWDPGLLLGTDVYGATLGIVGLGQIGMQVARRANAFGMTVLYFDVRRNPEAERQCGVQYVSLDDLLRQSDFVTLHVDLNSRTHHLIDDRALGLMKSEAILINTSRGPVVDNRALADALRAGRLRAAALDVTEIEPIPADDPLLTLPNAILTPHIASGSLAPRSAMADLAVDNILAGLAGKMPPNCLNPQAARNARPG